MNTSILVLGSTGKTGSRVLASLQQQHIPAIGGSRKSQTPFDWDDSSTWKPLLEQASAVYISFQPDLAVPNASETIRQFTGLARDCGVKKLVLLSGRGETEAQVSENWVIQSGLDHTIVRCSWFMQNFSESIFLDPILDNEVLLPVIAARDPFIDADDIADVVVDALTTDRHNGKVYELTGPELMTFREAVAIIAQHTGRDIAYTEMPIDDYTAALRAQQVPEDFIWLIRYLFTEVLDGRNESLTGDLELALGRKPRTFAAFAQKAAAAGAWKDRKIA